ncbi:phage minor head protein [Streptomyces sp. NPDC102437]|uniref:phage minor head protein n=1 Tax=Streptomyces sp. NPDC102437 TaxID=3366175 RepID=UPI0037FFE4F3
MTDTKAALATAERNVARTVRTALQEVAEEFADAVSGADELVAARFSVGSIARMWNRQVPRIVRRLFLVAETAAHDAADSVGGELDDTWTDLPARYDDGRQLPEGLGQYATTTEHLLRAVGDRLAETARTELAAGLNAGEDVDQLRARLREAFAREGAQLGTAREERIAVTEVGRAWNTATLEAGRALTGPDRPLVKQWRTRGDRKVRDAHDAVDGQLQLLDDPFNVAGVPMTGPGDPTAPAALVCNCRCVLRLSRAETHAAALAFQDAGRRHAYESQETTMENGPVTAAADGSHLQGAMIALIPTPEDAARLAIEGGEDVDELHLTLYFLGDDGTAWSEDQRQELADGIRSRVSELGGPLHARAFGANHWNAGSDSPSWVWAVGDDRDRPADAPTLGYADALITDALEDTHERPELPTQHSPWAPHVCAAYSADPGLLEELEARLGPITFDRIRLAFAGDRIDIPLNPEEETMPNEDTTADGMPTRAWSTPGDAGLAFENQQTGDGRVFVPGALEWSGPGPWPLQYADEMLSGHEGAELAGSINSLGRDGDRITGDGVLYLTQRAGAEAAMLLEEEAPLGVSVDLDDVDIEFVDLTMNPEDGGGLALAASLASASLLRLDDGGWMINASTAPSWTASGGHPARLRHTAQLITGPGGNVTLASVQAAFGGAGVLTAAAGDPDPDAGTVVHSESSGDLLIRITRARLRGATLVAMPAYDRARIVLEPVEENQPLAVALSQVRAVVAASPGEAHHRVVSYVCASPAPVGAAEAARALGLEASAVRGHLQRAAKAGRLVRLAPGLYIGPSSIPEGRDVAASATAALSRPAPVTHTHQAPDEAMGELVASAWTAMRDADPMPAAWFREPTPEELPPGSGGVHYAGGRIYGWVAQAGEPHAGYAGRNLTIESLGALDMTHFLRARFKLDDGSYVKAGAFTMNAPHSRDGAECDTASCQFDDTRTVAGVITVGLNERGLWFSGAAAPWLSQWDRTVFTACQPSYHMRQGTNGRWQLRAVLSVPVPGHSSPLIAAAVERSNLALAASAAVVGPAHDLERAVTTAATLQDPQPTPAPAADPAEPAVQTAVQASGDAADVMAALLRPEALDNLLDALNHRQTEHDTARRAEVERLSAAFAAAPPATVTF